MTKSIILLSGGIDSVVSLASLEDTENIELALFFNYGHKSFPQEKEAVTKLCAFYNIKLEIIDLPWLKDITHTALVNTDADIPKLKNIDLDNDEIANQSCSKVWVPNRNGVFISIAGAYADSYGFDKIIIGANKEEAATFKDNSADFVKQSSMFLSFSTKAMPQVIAPLINLEKTEIMLLGKKLNIPFEFVRSCYSNLEFHCGECESCKRLKRGLERAGLFDIVDMLFEIKE